MPVAVAGSPVIGIVYDIGLFETIAVMLGASILFVLLRFVGHYFQSVLSAT